MKSHLVVRILCVIAAGIAALLFTGCTGASAQTGDPNADNVEILTRGPVHEAFAEPHSYDAAQGMVVTVRPSEAIEEIPPEDMPEGDNVMWIPGYWGWDDDRDDYIWVSGIWRDPPPDRSWVPGYWVATEQGWIWTAGFWTDSESEEVEYLPRPPNSLEVGPSSLAPSADRFWTPGSWHWSGSRYVWRPGRWMSVYPDWVWQPAHYVWTPRGYVYIDGYWDRTLERRGVLFAPMRVTRLVRTRENYVYSPSVVIRIGALTAALFGSPDSNHYYFGDYYGDEYSRRGFRPWFEIDRRHRGYDPIYAHRRWDHGRTDDRWDERVREDYDYRRRHVDARPARTYSAQAEVVARAPERERKNLFFAVPLNDFSTRQDTQIRFRKTDSARRQSLGSKAKELRRFRDERVKWETRNEKAVKGESTTRSRDVTEPRRLLRQANPTDRETRRSRDAMRQPETQSREKPSFIQPMPDRSQRVKIPKSPIVGRRGGAPDRGENPPDRPEAMDKQNSQRDKAAAKVDARREAVDENKSKGESSSISGSPNEAPVSPDSPATPEDENDGEQGKRGGRNRDLRSRHTGGSI